MAAGTLRYKGKLGREVSLDDGQAAARLCGVNILAQINAVCGDLEQMAACLRSADSSPARPTSWIIRK